MKKLQVKFPPASPLLMEYGKKRFYSDLFRCAIGLLVAFGIVLGLQALWWLNIIFAMIGLAFLLYLWQVLNRTGKPLIADKDGLILGKKHLRWDSVQRLKLRHFGGNKHSVVLGSSFFELTVIGEGVVLRCDSGISHFKELMGLLLQATTQYDIEIDDNTAHNLAYLTKDNSVLDDTAER